MRILLAALLALALALAGFAQPDPDAPPDANPPMNRPDDAMMMMEMARMLEMMSSATIPTVHGTFVIRHGTLAKHSPGTLAPAGTLSLFGPVPVMPKDEPALRDLRHLAAIDICRRVMKPSYAIAGNDLVFVIGAQYFRVDMPTCTLKATSVVLDPDPVTKLLDTGRGRGDMMEEFGLGALFSTPTLQVFDGVTYLSTGGKVVGVRVADAKVLAQQPIDPAVTTSIVPKRDFGPQPDGVVAPPKAGDVVTTLGTFVQDPAAGWLLLTHDGKRYQLAAEQGARLKARADLATARMLVKGTYRKPEANAPKDPAGAAIPTLDVTAFLPLETAKVE